MKSIARVSEINSVTKIMRYMNIDIIGEEAIKEVRTMYRFYCHHLDNPKSILISPFDLPGNSIMNNMIG
jgi:hypothetical protein